jgi:hypothetical protein
MKPMKLLKLVLIAAIALAGSLVFSTPAQAAEGGGNDISMFVGSMLPNQIDGVSEVLPVFGGRYGLGTRFGMVELGGSNSHARGVDFTTIEANYRHDIPVDSDVLGLIEGGLDFNYYIPENESSRKAETGFHIAAGGMMMVSKAFWLRSDLKFMGGPGTSLTLLFGFVLRDIDGAN